MCPELPHLKILVNETFPDSDIPEVYVTVPDSIPKLKNLRTNHPCALCDFRGHYTHLCPRLDEYRSSLATYRQFKAAHDKIPSHLVASSTPVGPKDLSTPIHIPPPVVETIEHSSTIFYLSSSLRDDPSTLLPTNTLGSTSVDLGSVDVAHMSPFPQDDLSGIATSSGDPPSSSLPIFQSDEDIMEAMTHPDFPWDDMHHHAYFLP